MQAVTSMNADLPTGFSSCSRDDYSTFWEGSATFGRIGYNNDSPERQCLENGKDRSMSTHVCKNTWALVFSFWGHQHI